MYSCLYISIYDKERNCSRPILLGKLSVPLLSISEGSKWFALKDKNLCHKAKGFDSKILLDFSYSLNMTKAALLTFTPKQEPYLQGLFTSQYFLDSFC